jgi:hypothetical protein
MSAEGTARRSAGAAGRTALRCQWERAPCGALIARWRRAHRGTVPSEAQAVRAQSRVDRERSILRRRGARERLTSAAAVAALYLLTELALFSLLVPRDVPL